MEKIEQLKIDLFDLLEVQNYHQNELARLEQIKTQKLTDLKKLREAEKVAPKTEGSAS